jgi:hypothetical protein
MMLDEERARTDPDDDSENRSCKHREQFADEEGINRDCGRDDLYDLVRFLFDELGQQHAREKNSQEEKQHLADLCRDRAVLRQCAGRRSRFAHLQRWQGRLMAPRIGDDQPELRCCLIVVADPTCELRVIEAAGEDRGDGRALLR